MNRTLPLTGVSLASLLLVAACSGTSGGSSSQPPAPSAPVATPVATLTASPVTHPTPVPSRAPSGPISVALENATSHDVSIEMVDDGHRVVAARTGHPGDGASVPLGKLEAKNLDAKTVQFTWSDTPGDAALGLYVSEDAKVVLVIRPERPEGDAIAFDRVLVVTFDRAVDAENLLLGVQEGLDTAG